MSFPIRYSRFLWGRLAQLKFSPTRVRNIAAQTKPKHNLAMPCTIGFSIFTWLGFADQKLSAEDDLINTIKYCILFIQRTEFEKAEQLLHVALRQAQQIRNEQGITYIYDVMANLALERDHLDKAKKLFVTVSQRLIADGVAESDPRIIHISIKLARISHLKQEYEVAQIGYEWCLDKLEKALKQNPTEEMIKLMAITEDWYGRLFLDGKQLEQGLNLMTSALQRMREAPNAEYDQIVQQLNDVGTVYDQLGRSDEAIAHLKEAIELGKKLEDYSDLGIMYVNLGRAYLKNKMIEEARKSCGYGWRLGQDTKNEAIKKEAELCIKEVRQNS